LRAYTIPAAPKMTAARTTPAPSGHGALSIAESSSAAQKWTMFGDPNAATPASPPALGIGDSAIRAITTNWSPVSAAPEEPMIT
jgi:hypothetical protein